MAQTKKLAMRHFVTFGILCAIWGSTWLAIRVVVRDIPPFRAASLRFFIGAAGLLIFGLFQRVSLPRGKSEWKALTILSLTMMALPYGLIFWAEQHITSSVTAVLYSSLPLAVALLTPAMTGKPVPRSAIYSMLVAVGGIALLFQVDLRNSISTAVGGAAVLLAVVSSAYSSILAKQKTSSVHPVVATGIQLLFGAMMLGAVSLFAERGRPSDWNVASISALLFLAVFGSAVAFALFYWLLRSMQPYQLSTINLIVPFAAIVEGALILREFITVMMMVSAIIVLGAVGFVLKAESDEDAPTQLKLRKSEAGPDRAK